MFVVLLVFTEEFCLSIVELKVMLNNYIIYLGI